jgi:FkbM family methyltransferase
VIECALGSAPGRSGLNVTAETQFSSLHVPTAETAARFDRKTKYEVVEVEIRTLDEEAPRMADWTAGRRIYLKLDTQGHDLAVLEGAGTFLQSVDAMQSEVAIRPRY